MKRILTFKHWQLFLLIVCTGVWTSPSPLEEIVHFVGSLTAIIWIYAIGVYGQEKVQTMGLPTMDLKLFKINSYLIPILFVVVLILMPTITTPVSFADFDLPTILLIPIVLYSFFAVFQTVVFAFKTLATIEHKREVVLADYYVNLILTGFLIVGIWILQPKITRLIADNDLAPTA